MKSNLQTENYNANSTNSSTKTSNKPNRSISNSCNNYNNITVHQNKTSKSNKNYGNSINYKSNFENNTSPIRYGAISPQLQIKDKRRANGIIYLILEVYDACMNSITKTNNDNSEQYNTLNKQNSTDKISVSGTSIKSINFRTKNLNSANSSTNLNDNYEKCKIN